MGTSGDDEAGSAPSRRAFLRLGAASLGAVGLAACTGNDTKAASAPPLSGGSAPVAPAATSAASAAAPLTAADFAGLGTCTLTPATAAGSTAIDQQFMRRDITEGVHGQPMRMGLRVLDKACQPVPGALVEVWHADVEGDYSAVLDNNGREDKGPGTTFLRGTQQVDDGGIVEFLTVVPGWYKTRAVHVHVRVHLRGKTPLISQLFFEENFIHDVESRSPYLENGRPDTTLAKDSFANQSGEPHREGIVFRTSDTVTANGPGTLALLNLTIT
jgi:protocatechuate 3,4-dioxygenase beta subunit